MKQKGGVLTRAMTKKLEEAEGKKPTEEKLPKKPSRRSSDEAGPSNRPAKPAKRSSDEAGPSNRPAKGKSEKKKQFDEKKEIKKIENQFKAEMVGLVEDRQEAIKENARIRVQLIDRQIEVLTAMKNKIEEDIDDDLATFEELKNELALWRARKKALVDEVREQLDEEEEKIKAIKKQANREKYKITKLRKVLLNELKNLQERLRRIYWQNNKGKEHLNNLIKKVENLLKETPNTEKDLKDAIDNWYAIKEIMEEQENQRIAEVARAIREAQEEARRQQQDPWQEQLDRHQRALQEIEQRAEKQRIEEEEIKRQEQERKDIREGKKSIVEKRMESASRLSKTEKSVIKTARAFDQLKIYENKMKAIPQEHIDYVRRLLEMFKRFVTLGRELLQQNRNPTLEQIKHYTGFHLHRDVSNTATLKENLNYAEKVVKDIEKALAKDPIYYTRITRIDPFRFYCVDAKIDSAASVIYGEHIWQADKDLDSNLARVIEHYITPYCNDIHILYNLKKPENIKKAIDLYEHLRIEKVEEYVLNYPEVKKLCNTKAQCKIIENKLHELLKDPDSYMSITQEGNEQYVACSEDIPSLSKLRKNK